MIRKRVSQIIWLVPFVLLLLIVLDAASNYTVRRENIAAVSAIIAKKNGMKNATVIKTEDQGSSILAVLQEQGKYGFVVFNKSIFDHCYCISEHDFNFSTKQKYETMIADNSNFYMLTFQFTKNDISVVLEDKQSRWPERIRHDILMMLLILAITYLQLKWERSKKAQREDF